MDAVRKWRYAPTTLNGQPVEVDTTIDVIYSLGDKDSVPASGSAHATNFKRYVLVCWNSEHGFVQDMQLG